MVDWGSVPDWFAGVGGVGALVAAGFAAYAAWGSYGAQQDQLKQLLDDRKREHAARVAVWCFFDDTERQTYYRVSNDSGIPIYSVELHWCVFGESEKRGRKRIPFVRPSGASIPVPEPEEHIPRDHMLAGISFLDGGGHSWYRDETGRLSESRRG